MDLYFERSDFQDMRLQNRTGQEKEYEKQAFHGLFISVQLITDPGNSRFTLLRSSMLLNTVYKPPIGALRFSHFKTNAVWDGIRA
jgi:hypothetical protein